MKVKDLFDRLSGLEDFEITTNFWKHDFEDIAKKYGHGVITFNCVGITDIGVSDKVVILDFTLRK